MKNNLVKKVVSVCVLSLFLGFLSPLFSQNDLVLNLPPENPAITLTQEELTIILTDAIDKAVTQAVGIAVKPLELQINDLTTQVNLLKIDNAAKTDQISNDAISLKNLANDFTDFKKKTISDEILIGGISVSIGVGIGILIDMFLIKK
jgi:hypothetical protein